MAIIWAMGAILPLAANAQGTFRVRFDQNSYSITPGGTVSVGVVIDPAPEFGLFSYGLKVAFDEAWARVANASAITVPAPLDHNGVLGPGAIRLVQDGLAAVKGTVDFLASPPEFYSGTVLATIQLQDIGGQPGESYPITLDIYQTLEPTESVFVTGAGETLDGFLDFGSAIVTIVPEPSTALLLSPCIFLLWSAHQRRSRFWRR